MTSNVVCWKRRLAVLAITTSLINGCGTEPSRHAVVCPPIFAYDRAFQAQLADEIQRLPSGTVLERAMLDYARLRDQARVCSH